MSDVIAVCGATGQQGRAVVASLLARGRFQVRALTRQPDRARVAKGVEVVRADFDDLESLRAAFQGVAGVFAVTQPWSADYRHVDIAKEIAHGKNLAQACKETGVGHLVFSTVMKVSEGLTHIAHVDSKWVIEEQVVASGIAHTFLRPGTFMDNVGADWFPVKKKSIRGFTAGDAKLPFVCCRDIGEAAAESFANRERWQNRGVNLIGEFASGDQLAQTLGRIRGKPMKFTSTPAFMMRLFVPEFYAMRRAFEEAGRPPYKNQTEIDRGLAETKELHPGVWNLEAYLRQTTLGL